MRAVEPDGEEKRLIVSVAKLLGDPGGSDVIGELRFLIVLGAEIPCSVPSLRLLMDRLVRALSATARDAAPRLEIAWARHHETPYLRSASCSHWLQNAQADWHAIPETQALSRRDSDYRKTPSTKAAAPHSKLIREGLHIVPWQWAFVKSMPRAARRSMFGVCVWE